jgi:hypothetical protein
MTVRRRTNAIGVMAVTAAAVCGCASSPKYANHPRPALPLNLTVIVNNSGVSVSPASVGGGQVTFTITNQSQNQAEGLTIKVTGTGQELATVPPINPQGATQVTVNLAANTDYELIPTTPGAANASLTHARVSVGADRSGSRNVLMTP